MSFLDRVTSDDAATLGIQFFAMLILLLVAFEQLQRAWRWWRRKPRIRITVDSSAFDAGLEKAQAAIDRCRIGGEP